MGDPCRRRYTSCKAAVVSMTMEEVEIYRFVVEALLIPVRTGNVFQSGMTISI